MYILVVKGWKEKYIEMTIMKIKIIVASGRKDKNVFVTGVYEGASVIADKFLLFDLSVLTYNNPLSYTFDFCGFQYPCLS